MNMTERVRMVKAMEYIVRHVNNENFINSWLTVGVADGDIEHGDLSDEVGEIEYWIEDENFAYLMRIFLIIMGKTKKYGGLYCAKSAIRPSVQKIRHIKVLSAELRQLLYDADDKVSARFAHKLSMLEILADEVNENIKHFFAEESPV